MNYASRGRGKSWISSALREMAVFIHEEQVREHNIGFLPETFNRSKFDPTKESLSEKHLFVGEQYCHFLPQTDYIWNERGERTCNFVLRYEHFHSDFDLLAQLYGQKGSGNNQEKDSILENTDFKKHVYDTQFTHDDLDDELRDAYLKLYEIDLCLLGYDRDPTTRPPSLLQTFLQEHKENLNTCFHERDSRIIKR
jgi:hypothetical protein